MKKVLFVLSMLLCVVLFSSCSQNDESLEVKVQETECLSSESRAWEELKSQQQLLSNDFVDPATRGEKWRKFWDKVKNFVKRDCEAASNLVSQGTDIAVVGAALASIIGTFSAEQKVDSVKSSRLLASVNYKLPKALLNNVALGNTGWSLVLDNAGYLHNKLIIEVFNDNPGGFYTDYIYSDTLVNRLCGVFAAETGFSQSTLYDTMISSGAADYARGDSINLGSSSGGTHQSDLGTVNYHLEDFLDNFMDDIGHIDSEADLSRYTLSTLDLINNSDLANQIKKALSIGVLVASASSQLWGEYMYMIED